MVLALLSPGSTGIAMITNVPSSSLPPSMSMEPALALAAGL